MRLFTAALLLCIPVVAGAQVPDIGRGRALYENHCQVCHTPGVHSRINRLAITRAEVRELVDNWQSQQALRWHDQDIEDVVEFLDRTRYRFK